jgi:predicted metal-dependent hydrolase
MAKGKNSAYEGFYRLDGENIHYIVYRKAVKNYNLRVRKDGSLYISVPYRARAQAHLEFLSRHEDFLRRVFARRQQKAEKHTLVMAEDGCPADGVPFTVYGTQYQIERHPAPDTYIHPLIRPVEVHEHVYEYGVVWDVYYKLGISDDVANEETRRLIISKEIALLHQKIQQLLPQLQQRFSRVLPTLCDEERLRVRYPYSKSIFNPTDILVKNMKSRWGSCHATKGILTFNLQLIYAPEICTEYVICHELTHFLVQNHASEFYEILQRVMPNYQLARRLLNRQEIFD